MLKGLLFFFVMTTIPEQGTDALNYTWCECDSFGTVEDATVITEKHICSSYVDNTYSSCSQFSDFLVSDMFEKSNTSCPNIQEVGVDDIPVFNASNSLPFGFQRCCHLKSSDSAMVCCHDDDGFNNSKSPEHPCKQVSRSGVARIAPIYTTMVTIFGVLVSMMIET
eukprot:m.60853 g.60853  ORF g.60853 m.60853 type:complete len:166 (-) comp22893_c0_seq1:258-755(-)